MCRNIRTLFNFAPPATDMEIRAAALQYVRKIAGTRQPPKVNARAFEDAVERYTKYDRNKGIFMLRHRRDHIFKSTCLLFDQEKRRCTVYESRPGVCRKYPMHRAAAITISSSSSAGSRRSRTSSTASW